MLPLKDAYEECRLTTKREAKNFFYAFLTLPPEKRRAIYVAYAFCRHCDDAVDGSASPQGKAEALRGIRSRLEAAYQGRPQGAMFTALAHSVRTYRAPQQHFEDVISGVEMDLTKDRYETFEELRLYCYRVASAVGLICLEIFGYKNPEARRRAIDLGLAMQLTNILRDVEEDLERDRIYLPQQEMRQWGYSEADLRGRVRNDAQRGLMAFQVERARALFRSGAKLMPYLSTRSRACPAVLAQLYLRVLDRIERSGYNVFDGRISLSGREKLLVMATTWLKSFLPHGQPDTA